MIRAATVRAAIQRSREQGAGSGKQEAGSPVFAREYVQVLCDLCDLCDSVVNALSPLLVKKTGDNYTC